MLLIPIIKKNLSFLLFFYSCLFLCFVLIWVDGKTITFFKSVHSVSAVNSLIATHIFHIRFVDTLKANGHASLFIKRRHKYRKTVCNMSYAKLFFPTGHFPWKTVCIVLLIALLNKLILHLLQPNLFLFTLWFCSGIFRLFLNKKVSDTQFLKLSSRGS